MEVDSLVAVERSIQNVEDKIKAVEDRLEIEQDPEEKKYLREKEKQLRDEKKQLRDEKKELRDEKKLRLEEKILLLKSTVAGGSGVPDGNKVALFWKCLKSARETVENVEIDSSIVASSVSLSAIPPAATPDASSSELRVYKRRRMAKAKVVSKTLVLDSNTTFPHLPFGKLYVRKVYPKFVDIAFKVLMGKWTQQDEFGNKCLARHLFVTGTPGTGKTFWGFYLLYRLSKEDRFSNGAIVWEDCSKEGPGISYYFKGEDVRDGRPGDFDSLMDADGIFLVNGPVLRPRQMASHVIMFCSTKDTVEASWQVTKEIVKHTVYMPLWDLCELVLAGKLLDLNYEGVKNHYETFGGSARFVLVQFADKEWRKIFDSTLAEVENKSALSNKVGSMLQAKGSSSFVFHLNVLDDECTSTAVVFASSYVESKIVALAKLERLSSVVEYVNNYKTVKDEAVLVGKRFEFLFHKLMACPKVSTFIFKTRRMVEPTPTETENISFGLTGSIRTFHKLDDIPTGSVGYFVPDYSSYPCYDSILFLGGKAFAFQVTVNPKHPALHDYVEELLEEHRLCKFFYVVPEEMLATFPMQRCVYASVDYGWPDGVEVWVLGVPDTFFHVHTDR